MGKGLIVCSGGSGDGSDECTLIVSEVPKGMKAITADSDDEAREGTLDTTTSAADSHVLAGETYMKYNSDTKHWEKRTGTQPNRGAVSQTLNAGGSYTIPAGYHNGSGKVTANGLPGQTQGTAAAGDILSGKTAWVNGQKQTGTMEERGTWNSSVGMNGSVTIPEGHHSGSGKISGPVATQRGAVTAALNAGGSYTIPEGYHNGSGKVTANSLASQTGGATAGDGNVLSGLTYWKDGVKRTGTMPNYGSTPTAIDAIRMANGRFEVAVKAGYHGYSWAGNGYEYMSYAQVASAIGLTAAKLIQGQSCLGIAGTATSDGNIDASKVLSGYVAYSKGARIVGNLTIQSVVSFSAAQYSNLTLIASWAKPSRGPWSGLRIMCKQGGYPSSVSDGTLFYEGAGTSATKQLAAGTWYFRAWNYITTNQGRIYGGYVQATASNQQIRGQQTFTTSGVFTVPTAVRQIQAFVVGGGGGGGSGRKGSSNVYRGSGGGGGYTGTSGYVSVTPGQQIAVTIGSGGAGGPGNTTSGNGSAGGTTTVAGIISASGGSGGGFTNQNMSGGNGGSGGGGSGYYSGGSGGSNGGSGEGGWLTNSKQAANSSGQGGTTRSFGESGGTLYAGGGAGKGGSYDGSPGAGGGGSTGGGSGADGTGGGGGGSNNPNSSGGSAGGRGGSGLAIIRWGY